MILSISIFRRFSLFLKFFLLLRRWYKLSISIFRRFSLFRGRYGRYRTWNSLSISIFRRFSLFRAMRQLANVTVDATFNLHFQEIFFVSQQCHLLSCCPLKTSFNLHFQEIFFVSYDSVTVKCESFCLSISIFRRFSLFHANYCGAYRSW